jgi:aerobic-type carbon monoxide dehydrogenase small subunit (CoxS/CutS family)
LTELRKRVTAAAFRHPILMLSSEQKVVRKTRENAIAKTNATFNINGRLYEAEFEARTTLWELIAERIGLTGTVKSCNRATCGCCTVLVDGTPIFSCHILAADVLRKKILTIEGLSEEDNDLDPLQEIGYINHAAQCGYCTAGWLVAARALLNENPNPTTKEIKDSLSGHFCRCGAYSQILKTIQDVARLVPERSLRKQNENRARGSRTDSRSKKRGSSAVRVHKKRDGVR